MRSPILLLILAMGFITSVSAQKVKRKGVEPMKITPVVAKTATYSVNDIQGKWQETKRTVNDRSESFTDTLQLYITHDSGWVRDGYHLTMTGGAVIDTDNSLNLAGDLFKIQSVNKSQMQLIDGKYVRHFQKVPAFHFESYGKLSIKQEKFEKAVAPDLSRIIGKWIVYRRDALPGTNHDATLIRHVDIQKPDGDNSFSGEVGFYIGDSHTTEPAKILFRNNEMHVITDKNSWVESVYKTNGEEFVFGHNSQVIYYSKKP